MTDDEIQKWIEFADRTATRPPPKSFPKMTRSCGVPAAVLKEMCTQLLSARRLLINISNDNANKNETLREIVKIGDCNHESGHELAEIARETLES